MGQMWSSKVCATFFKLTDRQNNDDNKMRISELTRILDNLDSDDREFIGEYIETLEAKDTAIIPRSTHRVLTLGPCAAQPDGRLPVNGLSEKQVQRILQKAGL